MLIQELTRQASLDLLARTRLGRLACTQGTQPYVVPFYFVYDNHYLYSFSTVGQKIAWMRANPLVCVEVDEVVSPEQWMSVIVFGRYEELLDTPEYEGVRAFAHTLLQRHAVWWEPAYAKTILQGTQRPLLPVIYRIHSLQVTGRRAIPDQTPPETRLSMIDSGEDGWLQRLLRQVRVKIARASIRSGLFTRDGTDYRATIRGRRFRRCGGDVDGDWTVTTPPHVSIEATAALGFLGPPT